MDNLSIFKDNLHKKINNYCDIIQKDEEKDDEYSNITLA